MTATNEAAERLRGEQPATKAGRAWLAYFPEIVEFATVESILSGVLAIEAEMYDLAGAVYRPCCGHESEDGLSPHCWACDAHERSAGAAPIDVDVLAEAILRHDANDSWPLGSQIAHDRGKCGNERCARAIAAEYARILGLSA